MFNNIFFQLHYERIISVDEHATEQPDMESLTESHDAQEMMASGNGSSEEEENNGSGESDGTSSFHSEMLGFNLALFPAHGTFQKLRGMR